MRLPTFCLLLAALAAPLPAQPVIEHGNANLRLRISASTGRWLSLEGVLEGGDQAAAVSVTYGGVTTATTGRAHLWSIVDTGTAGAGAKVTAREVSGGTLKLTSEDRGWRLEQTYRLNGDTLARSARVTWTGQGETLLRWVDLRTPAWPDLKDTTIEAPGYAAVLHEDASRLPMGAWSALGDRVDVDAPVWRPGLILLGRGERNLLVWGHNQRVASILSLYRGDRGVWISQRLYVPCRLRTGESVEAGTQYLRVAAGPLRQAMARFQSFWDEAGVGLQGPTPEWARSGRIYEVVIGEKRAWNGTSAHSPYPRVGDLTADLGRIRDLGFNIVQVMPHFPYPNYSVHDYLDIATQYAPPAEFRRMIARAHELGMKVFFDVTMHGVTDKTVNGASPYGLHPWLTKHPDWFSYTEQGRVAKTYTWSFDHASPGFRDFMVEVFSTYVRDYGADGFRVDAVTWNWFPNWAKDLPRPGYQSIYGSIGMFERVRAAVRKIKPDAVFYTESTGPGFATCFDLSYNYDEQPLYGALLPVLSNRGYAGGTRPPMNARELAEWLDLRRLALPPSFIKVRHADSHDSHEWGGLGMFRREAFGEAGARLLFAYSALLDGAVMNFAGAEKGSEAFYKRVLGLRQSIPALREGACDYLAVRPGNNRVFAPLRRAGESIAIPVLSFSAEPVATTAVLEGLSGNFEAREELSGRTAAVEDGRLRLNLEPYAVQVWTLRPR
jgi:hypothetical protein